MKKFVLLVSIIFSVILYVGASSASAGWNNWTQAQKNQEIINRAYEDNGDYVGENCKEWVRDVVEDASSNAVTIPATHFSGIYWLYHQYVIGRCGYIEYAQPGEIVQMLLSDGETPHTAIIYSVSAYGVTFIESNWCVGSCLTVSTRYVAFATFYNQVDDYTIMYIQ